jgi:hypothetical protein
MCGVSTRCGARRNFLALGRGEVRDLGGGRENSISGLECSPGVKGITGKNVS